MSNIVVYTAVYGNYEKPLPIRWPGICLSDSAKLNPPEKWELRKCKPWHKDPRRASRHPKMLPHMYLPEAEYFIYMDANIRLLADPELVVNAFLRDHDMALFPHPQRTCIYDEGRQCIKRRKADPSAIKLQLDTYELEGYPRKAGLAACWVIVRRNTSATRALGQEWWKAYLEGTERDQLCFNYACWKAGIKYDEIPGNLFKGTSKFFSRKEH